MEDLKNIRVNVKNLSKGSVVYNLDTRHVRREWARVNQIIPIPADELQEAIYDMGVYRLFTQGYLGIDNTEHRKLIGLDVEGTDEPVIEPFDEIEAKKLLLGEKDLEKFKARLAEMRSKPGQIDTLTNVAFETSNLDYNKCQIIKEILSIDILNLKKNNEDDGKDKVPNSGLTLKQ